MKGIREHLDPASLAVIVITFVLFVTAVFVKGIGHDLLLEAGVFLVSVKLILMAYRSGVAARRVAEKLDQVSAAVSRLEELAGARRATTCDAGEIPGDRRAGERAAAPGSSL